MVTKRIARATSRGALVALFVLLPAVTTARAGEEADPLAVDRALRRVLRDGLPLAERVAAAEEALAGAQAADADTLLRAGLALLPAAPEAGAWLVVRSREQAWLDDTLAEEARLALDPLLAGADATAAARAAWAAAAFSVRHRPEGVVDALTAAWPPSPLGIAVLRREVPPPEGADPSWPLGAGAAEVAGALRASTGAARLLDAAESPDPAVFPPALDALLEAGTSALPLLLHEVRQAVVGEVPGRSPRATRAVLVLGLLGSREATPVLVAALDAPDGWVQVAAANALGDLGDPAAAVALCRKITYRGDVLRPRDQWEYPGERETTVPRDAWGTVEYFVTDVAAADALLRMGFAGAAGWLVHRKLDPTLQNFRIRVLQDTVDALRRSVPAAPIARYNIDAGIPLRLAAYDELDAWWNEHRFDKDLTRTRPAVDDPGFRREVRRMVERMRGRSIMELMIAQESCALLRETATPILLETLAGTSNRVLRTEIARALGMVGDPAAVDALLDLARSPASFVRAVAAEALGTYASVDPRVTPALLGLLDDPEAAPRLAALAQLVAAPVDPAIAARLRAHDPASHQRTFATDDRDYRMAWTVAMLVQEGNMAGRWDEVKRGLEDPERYVRRTWWDLLRRALGLPNHVYDAVGEPRGADWMPIREKIVLDALAARRSAS